MSFLEFPQFLGDRPTPERFYNRKGYYSINLMVVVDHQMRIRHFTARHCGSAHDARIFKESTLRAKLVQDFDENQPRVLIGDEGYACTNVLITPIRADRIVNEAQSRFNKALRKARITVEHSFGILNLQLLLSRYTTLSSPSEKSHQTCRPTSESQLS